MSRVLIAFLPYRQDDLSNVFNLTDLGYVGDNLYVNHELTNQDNQIQRAIETKDLFDFWFKGDQLA